MDPRPIDSEKLTNWYDFQAPFYRWWRDDYDGELVRAAFALLRDDAGVQTVLDAGCGTGLFAIGLARLQPGWTLFGVDASPGMIRVGRRKARELELERVSLRTGDVTALDFPDGHFDAVVAGGLFPNLNDAGPALAEFRRVLRPGGALIVAEIERASIGPLFRLFFRGMILGYRLFAAVVPRFRFAEGWNIERSTIERSSFEASCRAAGFEGQVAARAAHHLLYRWIRSAEGP